MKSKRTPTDEIFLELVAQIESLDKDGKIAVGLMMDTEAMQDEFVDWIMENQEAHSNAILQKAVEIAGLEKAEAK